MTTARCAAVLDGDTEALELLARGDASAGRVCIERFGPLVRSIALRMCRNRTDAEDATEDVFMELWKTAGRFDPSLSSPRVFVSMITRRQLIDRARSQRRHTVGRVPLSDAVTESRTSIGSPVGASEETSVALAQLQQLSPEQQSVVRLAVGESWTYERIAEHLNMPLGTVKTHVRRGLIEIRDALARRVSGGRWTHHRAP